MSRLNFIRPAWRFFCQTAFRAWLPGLLLGLALGWAGPARAAFNSTTPRGSFAGNINYVVTGGTLRTSDTLTCDVTNSSTAPLSGIPAGSTIEAAYLYWGGSGATIDSNVTLNGINVTADATYTDTFTDAGYDLTFFGGYKDVTSLITGNGIYTFSNLTVQTTDGGGGGETYCTSSAVQAGWALIVVYSNSSENNRVINVYDGIQHFYGSAVTTSPTNFKIPTTPIDGKTTVVTWEGDPGNSGNNNGFSEQLTFNGNNLTDGCNPNANQYNSTINTQACTGNATNDDIYYGVDIDTYDISSYLSAGQTSANLVYSSGADLVFLAAQVISTTNVPVSDLAITKSHTGNFTAGSNGVYTLAIHNNGPNATSGTTTVTDTLPTGLTYVSATGTGWNCGAAGQNVTCTTTSVIANGGDANPITLTVAVDGTAANPVVNTATVAVDSAIFDNISANDSSTDSATVLKPDLSTSIKDVVDINGGDAEPGDTLEYTITLTESAGAAATGVSVTDDIPAKVSGFTVISTPAGSTNNSTGSGGANGTGYLNVTGISVPANGSVTIVFDVTVAATDVPGDTIDNTATITNPNGPGATPAADTVTVSQSQIPASGNKTLYVYDNLDLTRTPQTGPGAGYQLINQGASQSWTLTPALQKDLTITAGVVSVNLVVRCEDENGRGCQQGTTLFWTATLYDNSASGTQIGSASSSITFNDTAYSLETANIAVGSDTTVPAGHKLVLVITNVSTKNHAMRVEQYDNTAGVIRSTVSLNTSTVINVDSVGTYTDASCATALVNPVYETQSNVFICAVVSDPFGSYDIDPATGGTAPTLTIKDANGTTQVNAADMTEVADSGAATKTFEYTYIVPTAPPATLAIGNWTPSVTATEGTEGTVTHTANGNFEVEMPNLMVMKAATVVTDPVNCTTAGDTGSCTGTPVNFKSIPGSVMQYLVNVSNNGKGAADSDSIVIADPVPADTAFVVGSVSFADGTTSSGLTWSAADVSYSSTGNTTCADAYTPADSGDGTDPAVTNLCFAPQGSMAGKTGATAPSFSITFRVKLK